MNPEANIDIYKAINEWNPLSIDDIDAEVYEMMDLFYKESDKDVLASEIDALIYFSFLERIDYSKIYELIDRVQAIQKTYHVEVRQDD